MRSGTNCTISSGRVHSWALEVLIDAKLNDHGWKCAAAVVLGITLRAAARCICVSAACRDLAKAPLDQGVMMALEEGSPKTLLVLERRLNDALIDPLPKRMRRRAWNIAIDWHLQTYYGQLLATLGIAKSHSRPHVSKDNPFSVSQVKTVKYRPEFPDRFASHKLGLDF